MGASGGAVHRDAVPAEAPQPAMRHLRAVAVPGAEDEDAEGVWVGALASIYSVIGVMPIWESIGEAPICSSVGVYSLLEVLVVFLLYLKAVK